MSQPKLYVVKRDGRHEGVHYDKITSRIEKLAHGLDMEYIDCPAITYKVVSGLYPGVSTVELDNLAAETAASMTTRHPDYAILAGRIAVSNLHKQTKEKFSEVVSDLYHEVNPYTGQQDPGVSAKLYDVVQKHAERLDAAINYERDFDYHYFGFKTLERSYLTRINEKVVERPQHLLMRVALGIHDEDIEAAIETYNLLSQRWFTHASPTLFNAGTNRPQLSSCFLIDMLEDSLDGIWDTSKHCARISKTAGGIGLSVHRIRARGTRIAGTKGRSDGLVPMLQVFNWAARYVNQGGRRPGAVAVYLEPWHADIFEFLDLKKNVGAIEVRARDLFYAMWIPDLFMRRVEEDGEWSLMCPHKCPGLFECWGEKFDQLYTRYEAEGKYNKKIKARKLWFHIVDSQIETGMPYMLYKDACNGKSNQQNLGTIKSSNLCTEIVEYTSKDEVAVCNLASIALNRFVDPQTRTFDFQKLQQVTSVVTRNLNKIIDINLYPIQEAYNSNMRHRPIGIGVQGLADAFILMRYPFDSPEAKQLNKQIFENIYYAACRTSCELARVHGPYSSYQGSPASQGKLQYDLWGVDQDSLTLKSEWAELKAMIAQHGMRNSLLIAPMPTASTAQILGNNESIEPYTSNIYVRRVLSGEFQVVNPHLMQDLIKLNLWNDDIRNQIIKDYGSVQHIAEIPDELKRLYKTVWEISQKVIIDMAADRGVFIDQSQSMNIHMAKPSRSSITSMHFYGWKAGLKTGLYYLRTKPAANPIQFTVDKSKLKKKANLGHGGGDSNSATKMLDTSGLTMDDASSTTSGVTTEDQMMVCRLANGPNCESCSG